MSNAFSFNDLIDWSTRLPDWQRDALRRVLVGAVSSQDIVELSEMAKAVYGGCTAPAPIPAASIHVRPSTATLPAVRLVRLQDISRVNALAPGPISFAMEGLTVVYGENASGKSGITRILKKACRARDPGRTIRPSVFDPPTSTPASALFTFRVNGQDHDFAWCDGARSDENLATISVFDGDCAAVQVEKANRLSYTPEILQAFSELATICDQVGVQLRAQRDQIQGTQARFPSTLRPDTPAGVLLCSLSKDTDPSRVDAVCRFTDSERQRKSELARLLHDKPIERARAADSRRARLEDLERRCGDWARTFSDSELAAVEGLFREAAATTRAAEAARSAFASDSRLDGLGTDVWRQLWESARRYSEHEAYPGQPFPVSHDGALCVLCQQPLTLDGATRLRRFDEFVRSDVQQRAARNQQAVETRRASVASVSLPLSRCLVRDMELEDVDAGRDLRHFVVRAKLRRRYLLRLVDGRQVGSPPGLTQPPDFTTLTSALFREAEAFRAAARADERQKLERELQELTDSEVLEPLREAIHGEIDRLRRIHLLDQAIADCNTARITRKAGEVERVVLTASLRNEFNQNLAALGFSAPTGLEVQLGPGQYGEHPYHLSLTVRPDVPPADVLSDGEKRCVALAGFLAELDTIGNSSALILDDPVSSLDHRYRDRVAQQLVSRSLVRQVIVFTHDIVFLRMLQKHSRTAGVAIHEIVVNRGARVYGIPGEGPPWIAMRIKQRLGILRSELQAAEALLNKGDRAGYEQKAEWIYGKLRSSWERALEELLLNEVVVRFGDEVQTQRLRRLTDISEADVNLVEEQMSRCSRFMHDQAGAVNEPIPEPDFLRSDLKRLADWVEELRRRGRS